MPKIKTLFILTFFATVAGCSEYKPTPQEIAKSNLTDKYTLTNGVMLPLDDYYCGSDIGKAGDGTEFIECRAKLKGYAHYEIHFCPTKSKMRCNSDRPK